MVRWQISAILGVAAAVAVTAAALITKKTDISIDLGTRSGQVLAGEATSWASVDIRGRDVYLRGDAPSEENRQLAIERLGRLYGVRMVDASAAGLLPEIRPYVTALERNGDTVVLTGAVPSLPDRARILGALATAAPGLGVVDHSLLARGKADDRYFDVLRPLYGVPALLSHGKVTLTDKAVAVAGEAISNAAYDRLKTFSPALPEGYSLAVSVSRPLASPFVWSIDRDDSGVTVSGFVPDPATRNTLLDVVRQAIGPRNVFDNLDYASGAPDGFAETAAAAVDYLDLLASAHIALNDHVLVVSGRAASPEAYRTLNAYLETWNPPGFVLQKSIALPIVEPFTLAISKSHGRVTVTGFVPTDDARGDIADAAQAVASNKPGDSEPVVETTLADGAPAGFDKAAQFAIGLLAKLDEGTALLSGTHLTLSGAAATSGDFLELEAAIANPPAGYDVGNGVTPPMITPYVWSMVKDADQLTIAGSAPSEAIRGAIRAVIDGSSNDLGLVDRSGLGSGLDPAIDLVAVARKAVAILTELDSGEVRLVGNALSVTGKASTTEGSTTIGTELDALPTGVIKGNIEISAATAFRFFVERGLDTVTLDGDLADDAMRKALAAAADRAFGKADILDSSEVAKSAPAGARDAALFAIRAASLLAKGNVSIEGTVIRVTGSAFTAVGAARLSSELSAAVPPGFSLEIAVNAMPAEPPLEAAACAEAIGAVLLRTPVRFDDGAATVASDSRGVIDRLGALALRCPAARFVLTATASGADAARAQTLGEARARSIAGVFAEIGIDPARLTANGAAGVADGLSVVLATP
ncbi:BON domain-containing protein [Pleomorphomonas sp. PLEO]|uniref:BON domain-containing protein n=1 Tax=Pleomorphomonas sp. PLEO TaxID=3239306 RepID=UPI00351F0E32